MTIHFFWAICMRQDVALPACFFFFFLHCGESGREGGKNEVFASTDVNEGHTPID